MTATAALLLFVGSTTLVAAVLSILVGALVPLVGAASLALGALVSLLAVRACARLRTEQPPTPSAWDLAALGLLATLALRQFLFLLFEREGVVRTANAYNYGDLPLHITYIESLARGVHFWPENPIFTGERLRYPIGMDLWNAVLLQLGVPLAFGLVASGLVATLLLGFTLRRWGGALAIAGFVLSGGIGVGALAWLNLFLALFVTQRGFLFALPAGLLLLLSWRERILRRTGPGLPVWVEGLLWGLLPLFHLHTFLFVSVIFALWTVARSSWRESLGVLGFALGPASFGVFEVTDHFRAAALVGWAPGWVIGERNPWLFMLQNFGLLIPLVIAVSSLTVQRRLPEWRLAVLPAVAIWVALFFVKLAPWAWDNTKVMLWCYVLLLPSLGDLLARLATPWRAGLIVLWLAPGTSSVVAATFVLRSDLAVYGVGERRAVCEVVSHLPPDARVATKPIFNHPVALCGQPIVEGYAGHLWSHGIDARAVEARLRRLMLGLPGWEQAAQELDARYLFWGKSERGEFSLSARPWETSRRVVAEGDWGRLYSLSE